MYLRNYPADILKVVLSLLVVLGHINSPYTYSIFSFHMPFFFILSGFFLDKNVIFKNIIVKDSKRLLLPFLVFSILGFVTEILKRIILSRDLSSIFEVLIDAYFFINSEAAYYGFALWFLPVLFLGKQMSFYMLNQRFLLFSFFLSFVLMTELDVVRYIVNLPFGVGKAYFVCSYIIFGHLYFRFSATNKNAAWIFSVLYLLLFIDKLPYFDIGGGQVPGNISQILFPIFLFCLVYPLLTLFRFSLFSKVLSFVTPSLMLIYLLHPYTNNISFVFFNVFLGDNLWYATFFGSVLLLSPVIFLKHKFSHWKIFEYV
ncbi:acyltransferase family protein [Vibrio hepatarius]|uniref:acyltransferase family protein n=1 Tax=Vibrio hepatarius TaxID=171383 RepID=UPI001C081F36|nr:acyltransferase family protein [Vibrio hepatarius]MBU2896881.1 acyltransferase family protein [Vibrio hepatarius]